MDITEYAAGADIAGDPLVVDLVAEVERLRSEPGNFLRMVADAWGADPDGWSHYIETDRDTRNLLRDLAEKLDKQQYDLN